MRILFLVTTLCSCLGFSNGFAQGVAGPVVNINPSTDVGTDISSPYFGFDEAHGNGMIGWTFQLLVPFTVTHVGWYNQDTINGLSREFQVGL